MKPSTVLNLLKDQIRAHGRARLSFDVPVFVSDLDRPVDTVKLTYEADCCGKQSYLDKKLKFWCTSTDNDMRHWKDYQSLEDMAKAIARRVNYAKAVFERWGWGEPTTPSWWEK